MRARAVVVSALVLRFVSATASVKAQDASGDDADPPNSLVAEVDSMDEVIRRATDARAARAFDVALAMLDAAITRDPANPRLHVERGTTLAWAGRLPEARAAYHRAHQLDPRSTAALCGEARVLGWLGRIRAARTLAAHAIALEPDALEPRLTRAMLDGLDMRLVAARRGLDVATRWHGAHPGIVAARTQLARVRRSRTQLGLEAVRRPGATSPGFLARTEVDVRRSLRLAAGYAFSAAALPASDPSGTNRRGHRIDASLHTRIGDDVRLELRTQALVTDGIGARVGLHGTVRIVRRTSLELGADAGRAEDQRRVAVIDGGLVVPIRNHVVLLHGYVSLREGASVATTGTAAAILAFSRPTRLRLGASTGRLPQGRLHGAQVRVEHSVSSRLGLFVAGEWNGGCIERLGTTAGVEVRR